MKKITSFFKKNNFLFIFFFLSLIYLSLAFKNPFQTNNLISNLEPSPDVFYYSVPAWNLVHGKGFKMEAFGIGIGQISTPLYGFYLSPFFLTFNDVRSYYFANLLLCFVSIFLFLKLVEVFLGKERPFLKFALGLVLVTNFYFYNLPTLLMAENILIPLTLLGVILTLRKLSLMNFLLTLLTMVFLIFAKVSSLPILFIMGIVLIYKIIKSNFLKKIPKKIYWVLAILFVFFITIAFIRIVLPGLRALPKASDNFSINYIGKTLPIFLKEFLGINGSYLWFNNQQIEQIIGLVCLVGMFLGLILKKYRNNVLILMSFIFSVTLFHSMMSYPEGRYISTVIPLFLLFSGIILKQLKSSIWVFLFLAIYFLPKVTVNGFYERKATTLKRQIFNNRLENNEVPWNYMAISSFNKFFDKKNEDVYFGSLLPPFYFYYFSNNNYQYLPISERQEFGGGRDYLNKVYQKDGNLLSYYERLLESGKHIYISNYYFQNNRYWVEDYKKLETKFVFSEMNNDCMGLCRIYEVKLKDVK